MKVQLFDSVSLPDLQQQINLFLEEIPNSHIQNISITTQQSLFIAIILYSNTQPLIEREVGVYIHD